MARLSVLLFLIQIVLAVIALISCLSAEEERIRALPRFAWVLIILVFPLIGSIAWFLAGRPTPATPAGPPATRGGSGRVTRPVAPDDDPEFLKSIAEQSRREDAELFRRWEEDLRRREDDLRRREDEPPREDDRPQA
ncbi:PLD nuclease N-terminal domain-containing protein [Micromonospora coxensis]|uniref:Phospholipase_D-nuclease N-terminal n=1 Tax=Micromonospora coxensis TaxID=356852 RepID=A0A1C5JEN1_9ACTN|nr:PLD nuclease N-terminal domain-containing protein [Micromonospora coxensis]SCG69044.1 Phospholipase_D-nuclease N-terminal [Micromonospora coxensis]